MAFTKLSSSWSRRLAAPGAARGQGSSVTVEEPQRRDVKRDLYALHIISRLVKYVGYKSGGTNMRGIYNFIPLDHPRRTRLL